MFKSFFNFAKNRRKYSISIVFISSIAVILRKMEDNICCNNFLVLIEMGGSVLLLFYLFEEFFLFSRKMEESILFISLLFLSEADVDVTLQ